MYRRRIGRIGRVWPPLRPWAQSPLEARSRQDLQHANRLMEIGDFANAAVLYEKLARKVHDASRPRQAGHLYVQAARARLFANQVKPCLDMLEQGLSIFAQAGFWEAFERIGNRAMEELRQQNQPQAAQDLTHWLETVRKNRPVTTSPAEVKDTQKRSLPLKCPSCGATIRPDEAEWVDEVHAVCNYCGSMLAAE